MYKLFRLIYLKFELEYLCFKLLLIRINKYGLYEGCLKCKVAPATFILCMMMLILFAFACIVPSGMRIILFITICLILLPLKISELILK